MERYNELVAALKDKTKNVFQRRAIYDAAISELMFNNDISTAQSVKLKSQLDDIYIGWTK